MIPYASRTGTKRNLDRLRTNGWGLLVSATGVHRTEGFELYAIDNGAWTAHQQGIAWDRAAFELVVEKLGADAAWIVLPDIVGGGRASLDLSLSWVDRLKGVGQRRLLAVQDGMNPLEILPLLGRDLGLFVGGSTEWKLASLPFWAQAARISGAYLHVGRVNTVRRIRLCALANADSFDGTSATRFAVNIERLTSATQQAALGMEI